MYSLAMGQINKGEEKKMEATSFRGNRIGISITAVAALSLVTAAGTYRLKKTAEIKKWQKALTVDSVQLENENKAECVAAGYAGQRITGER